MSNVGATQVLKDWYDRLEPAVHAQAHVAGVHRHRTSKGTAREFVVRNVLRAFLPPAVGIGQGEIVHRDGTRSKQLDVVVYDARFPRLELPHGPGLYFAESVIAVVEVKSVLDAKEFAKSLVNCESVVPQELFVDAIDVQRRCHELSIDIAASQQPTWMNSLLPRTYVFAFSSKLSPASALDVVIEHLTTRGSLNTTWDVWLPRVVAAGKLLGMFLDESFSFVPNPVIEQGLAGLAPGKWDYIGLFLQPEHRLGVLAADLSRAVSARFGAGHDGHRVRMPMDEYFPLQAYVDERRGESGMALAVRTEEADGKRHVTNAAKVGFGPK